MLARGAWPRAHILSYAAPMLTFRSWHGARTTSTVRSSRLSAWKRYGESGTAGERGRGKVVEGSRKRRAPRPTQVHTYI